MRIVSHCFVLLLLISLLSACGFHMRSSQTLTDIHIKQLYLETQSPYSLFSKSLKQQLHSANVELVNDKNSAPLTVVILSDNQAEREISVSGNGQIRRVSLTQTIQYQLRDSKNQALQPPKMISSQRFWTTSQDQMLASDNDKAELEQAMAEDCANQLLIQLNSPQVKTLVAHLSSTDQKKSASRQSKKPVL